MIPYLLIALLAIIGLFLWGLKGLVIGGVVGHIFSLLFGLILKLLSGGLLPRKVRRETARNFMALHPDLVRAAYPHLDESQSLRAVERAADSIFRKAVEENKSMNIEAAWTREAIQDATASLIDQETRPEMGQLLRSLLELIERDMYL